MALLDLIGAEIETRHLTTVLKLTFEGMEAGGVVDMGFVELADPRGLSKILLTADFNGYSNSEIALHNKTMYPTKVKRQLTPNQLLPDFEVSGTDYILRFVMDSPIFTNCTNLRLTLSSGLYTDVNGPSNGATNYIVTNSSTQGYQDIKANFSIPLHGRRMGFNEFTATNDATGFVDVRVMAYSSQAANGNGGIDCVKVTATGQSSLHSETITLTEQVDQTTYGDIRPIGEYIGRLTYSGFTEGELVDIVPVVYPYIGETPFDFSAQGNSMPSCKPCTHTMICDKEHTYGTCIAVVDTAGGAGVVVNYNDFDPLNPPAAFATRGAAAAAIQTYINANFGRNDHGGGVIYMNAGNHDVVGASIANPINSTYLVTLPFPGVDRADVVFVSQTGVDWYCARGYELIGNCTFNLAATVGYYTNNLILFNNDLQAYTTFYTTDFPGCVNLIGGRVIGGSQGLSPYSANVVGVRARGLYYENITARNAYCDVMIGCHVENSALSIRNLVGTNAYGTIKGGIIAYNYIRLNADTQAVYLTATTENSYAFVNNIIIQQGNTTTVSSPLVWIYADQSDINPHNNLLKWHNNELGERSNMLYNDYNLNDVGPGPRLLASIKNNIICDFDNVTDIDAHGGTADDDRYGNHAIHEGVDNSGNYCRGTGASTLHPTAGAKNYFQEPPAVADVKFVDDQSGMPGAAGTGNGDYHLQADSPAINWAYEYLIKFDADGNLRIPGGSSGAYECAASSIMPVLKYYYDRRRR